MSTFRLQAGPRAIALEIAAEARAEWGFATDIIARTFRAHRELASGARRLIAETVYGLIRMDRRLDAIVDELRGGRAGATCRWRRWRATSSSCWSTRRGRASPSRRWRRT